MAFRIHEDQENGSLAMRKDADIFSANQRRALGDLSQFACNQNRSGKLVSCFGYLVNAKVSVLQKFI